MSARNWPEYNNQLKKRGSITFLIEQPLLTKMKNKKGRMGRPLVFSDELIMILLMCKINFSLPYRALEAFAPVALSQLNIQGPSPSYTQLCRRARKLKASLPNLPPSFSGVIALDASGFKVYGEGEWIRKIHGKSKSRSWIKLHIGIDVKTGSILSAQSTPSNHADCREARPLLKGVRGVLKQVCADGAYDTIDVRKQIKQRGAYDCIPPRRTAVISQDIKERDRDIGMIQALGGDLTARSIWGKLTGYSLRSLVETAFSRMKRLFGDRMFSQHIDSQIVENHIKCLLLNKLNHRMI